MTANQVDWVWLQPGQTSQLQDGDKIRLRPDKVILSFRCKCSEKSLYIQFIFTITQLAHFTRILPHPAPRALPAHARCFATGSAASGERV